jgi:hypothetical protein
VSAGHWPKVDYLADGRWLVASTLAALKEQNGRLFAADGTLTGTFEMGDGIEHIRCAPDGTIWVGYFDDRGMAFPATEPIRCASHAGTGGDATHCRTRALDEVKFGHDTRVLKNLICLPRRCPPMSLFDYIVCEAPLPDGFTGELQTKDLGCYMLTHVISSLTDS